MRKISVFFLFLTISFLAYPQAQIQKVVAKRGDGIYSLLRQHGLSPSKHYQQFIDLNKKNLTAKNTLYAGRTYVLPVVDDPSATNIDSVATKTENAKVPEIEKTLVLDKNKHPFFGNDITSLPLVSNNLKGAVYYLIAGHGGPDPGAVGTYGGRRISEDEYAYDVTLRLASRLLSNGAEVYMIIHDANDGIRDKQILKIDYDEVNYKNKTIPRSQKLRLRQRASTVNELYKKNGGRSRYQRLIEIHIDSRGTRNNIDVFFYHYKNSKSGKRFAENLLESFRENYAKHQPNRKYAGTVSYRNLYMINNTLPPIAYIELGNINNSKDQQRILNYNNREALAKWIYGGALKDFQEK